MAHEAQVRYSKLVDLKLRATLVKKVGVICNSRYEGSPKAGSVKVPVRDTEVAVNDYDKQTGAELTGGDTITFWAENVPEGGIQMQVELLGPSASTADTGEDTLGDTVLDDTTL